MIITYLSNVLVRFTLLGDFCVICLIETIFNYTPAFIASFWNLTVTPDQCGYLLTVRNLLSVKDSVPRQFRSRVIYKLTYACCNACCIGGTGRLSWNKSSHIFKHLQSSERCRQSFCTDCFEILDSAPTKFQLKLKEAMHIDWVKPSLNQQVQHVNLTLLDLYSFKHLVSHSSM